MGVKAGTTIRHLFTREEIEEAVKAALLLLGGCYEISPRVYRSDIGMTYWSWGERVTVDVSAEGIMKIASESTFSPTLIDYGKNKENVSKVLNGLKYAFMTSGLAKSNPEAYSAFLSDENANISSPSSGERASDLIVVTIIIAAIMLALGIGFLILFILIVLLFSMMS